MAQEKAQREQHLRVAVYYRISTKDKQSFDSQKIAVESWLSKEKITPQYVIEDKESGSTESRTGYRRLIDLSLRKKIDAVVCYKLDRFGRNARSVIKRIIEIEDMGVRFVAMETPGLNTLDYHLPFRMMFLSAFASLAEMERDALRDRVRSGLNAARRRGVKLGRPTKATTKNKKMVVELRKKNYSIRAISKQLKISPVTIQKLLKS
ncbi:MAG: recombinase family protein [Deltaproteobacteria bacterium]|nr:recombinase family protein [Deltaproteobacteria bacterium]